jgi:hypothetical protein
VEGVPGLDPVSEDGDDYGLEQAKLTPHPLHPGIQDIPPSSRAHRSLSLLETAIHQGIHFRRVPTPLA